MKESSDLPIYILTSIICTCTWCIGLFLHIKIILVSKKDKDITWKLDILNSSLLIIHITHTILMNVITYLVPDLYMYTGEWICYLSKFMAYYGNLHVTVHSLMISTMKYILIVHWQKARAFGHDKIKHIFFWLELFYPIIMMLIHLLSRPDFFWAYDGFAQIDRCLGDPKNNWGINTTTTQNKFHTLCLNLEKPGSKNDIQYTIYVLRSGLCWIQLVVIYFILWNIFEMVIYYRVFGEMRR